MSSPLSPLSPPAAADLEGLAAALLAYLRVFLALPELAYVRPLTPLPGGFEAFTGHFQLAGAPAPWSGPLVLRRLRPEAEAAGVLAESAVQNLLAAGGYPAPRVLVGCADPGWLGGPFLIMDYLAADTMFATSSTCLLLLGEIHADLHEIDAEPLTQELAAAGLPAGRYRLGGRLERLAARARPFPGLGAGVIWLADHQPPEPARPAICHGDFHPFNVLMQDEVVAAVLDWSAFVIADPLLDVAGTMVICAEAGRALVPDRDWDGIIYRYLETYQRRRPLALEHLGYYQALRYLVCLVEAAEGQELWTRPGLRARLAAGWREHTGLDLKVGAA